MRIKIFTVGKFSLKPFRNAAEDYRCRLRHYFFAEMEVLKTSVEILKKEKSAHEKWIFLDEMGEKFSSIGFAKWIEKQQVDAVKSLIFFVGPAEGWISAVKQRADKLLSLSSFTLQHELALVVLLEQIYRSCTILRGEPYHK